MNALEAEGALCEVTDAGSGAGFGQAPEGRDDVRAVAVLPAGLARRLEVSEELTLAPGAVQPGEVACGIGSPLLEKLIAEARAKCPVLALRLQLEAPRPGHARALAERFVLRNGVTEVREITMGAVRYAVAHVAYVVEADDRREGLVRVVTSGDGGEPDLGAQALFDLGSGPSLFAAAGLVEGAEEAARWVALRAGLAVRAAAGPRLVDVSRRHARDHDRIASYFAALIAEAKAPRRKTEQSAVDAKVAHLVAERDKKLRDLRERFAVTVRASLAALAWVELPVAQATLRLRRRKEERVVTLRVPPGASLPDRLACEACGAATPRPAACDDRLHLLCEACVPSAQGRPTCGACARARRA
jgi:hypothetical protein